MKILIVGCGFTGATIANQLAQKGHDIRIIDKKPHVGGNCYDYFNAAGIDVHQYGTHIFHTESKEVWDFVSQYTDWFPYQHEVKALVDGQLVPIPFNFNTIEALFPKTLADKLIAALLREFPFNKKVPILLLRQSKDKDLQFLAEYVYEKIFLHYTVKQWGVKPEDLDPLVTGRVPVFIGKDNRYFNATYQGIPLEGYTKIFDRMLDHPKITVELETEFREEFLKEADYCFYTGAIDEFYSYCFGALPYRSLEFKFLSFDRPYFQSNSVINYPCNYGFTRIGEYKYFLDTRCDSTVVSYEYPREFKLGQNERYYPIINDGNKALYEKYLELSKKESNVQFMGRLGDYKYYDMDQAIARALKVAQDFE